MSTRTCPICGIGSLEPGRTTSTVSRGSATVVVRNVPACVCDNCGEAYVDGETTDRLLEVTEAAFRSGLELAIQDFAKAA